MTFADFHNGLRVLASIDGNEVPFLLHDRWVQFRDDPWRFFIRCDDETAEKIWGVVQTRMNKSRAPAELEGTEGWH